MSAQRSRRRSSAEPGDQSVLTSSASLGIEGARDVRTMRRVHLHDHANAFAAAALRLLLEGAIELPVVGLSPRRLDRCESHQRECGDPPHSTGSESKDCHAPPLSNDEASRWNYGCVETARQVSHVTAWQCLALRWCARRCEGLSRPVVLRKPNVLAHAALLVCRDGPCALRDISDDAPIAFTASSSQTIAGRSSC